MSCKIVVTGIGIISAIGNNKEQNLEQLQLAKTGIRKAKFVDSIYKDKYFFGEIPFSNEELIVGFKLKETEDFTRTDILAEIAFQEAIQEANWTKEEISSEETAFISASTVGGMSEIDHLFHDSREKTNPSKFIQSYAFSAHAKKMIKRHALNGETAVLNTACSSSSNSILLACRMLQQGKAARAIVGGVDALSKFTINGFNSLQILSSGICKAFDADRDGLNLGEAAVYLTLEILDENNPEKKHYGEVVGYGNANDSFHPSTLSDDGRGIKKAIHLALEKANIQPEDIDFIQAHGTGTENNDLVESNSMKAIFERKIPFFSSKTYVGHTLAASGALGAVYCLFGLKNEEIYASLNCQNPIPSIDFSPNLKLIKHKSKFAMTNAFGFNGNCTSLIFKK